MKIGYFITHFPYQNYNHTANYSTRYMHGGAEIATYHLAKKMAQRGHQIEVFTTSIDSKDSFHSEDNLHLYRYGTNLRIIKGNISFKLFREPLKHDVDIIHANFTTPPAELAALSCARRKKVPLILTYHGDWQAGFGKPIRRAILYFYNRFILNKLLSQATVIISLSEFYIDESRFLNQYRDKIAIVPLGVDIAQFDISYSKEECRRRLGLPLDDKIILFLGNLTPYKGPEVLVKAMPQVVNHIPDCILLFVGGGILRGKLERLTQELGIVRNVKFTGFIAEELKPLYYKAADAFVLPSTMNTEVFPRVFLEASAAKLPMIVSDLRTFRCIIEDGYNGIVTRRGDESELAQAIVGLLQNQPLRVEMGENARKKVENYSWDKIADQMENLYAGVIQS